MPLVPEFLKLYPEVELDITLNDSIIDLWQERTDLAIRSGALKDSALKARPITLMRRLVVVSPAISKNMAHQRDQKTSGDIIACAIIFSQASGSSQTPKPAKHYARLFQAIFLAATEPSCAVSALKMVG